MLVIARATPTTLVPFGMHTCQASHVMHLTRVRPLLIAVHIDMCTSEDHTGWILYIKVTLGGSGQTITPYCVQLMQDFLLSIVKLLIHILLGQRSNDLNCPSSSPALSCGSQHLGAWICFAVAVFPLLIRDNLISNNLPPNAIFRWKSRWRRPRKPWQCRAGTGCLQETMVSLLPWRQVLHRWPSYIIVLASNKYSVHWGSTTLPLVSTLIGDNLKIDGPLWTTVIWKQPIQPRGHEMSDFFNNVTDLFHASICSLKSWLLGNMKPVWKVAHWAILTTNYVWRSSLVRCNVQFEIFILCIVQTAASWKWHPCHNITCALVPVCQRYAHPRVSLRPY